MGSSSSSFDSPIAWSIGELKDELLLPMEHFFYQGFQGAEKFRLLTTNLVHFLNC